jgi:hypothetical protein
MANHVRPWTPSSTILQYEDGENAVLSLTEKEPKISGESSPASGKEVRVTVTGLDEKGQMFRETAPILEMDGRDCHFRSKFQPELGSWVLVEFDLTKSGAKRTTVQGQVKSAQTDLLSANMYRIHVELETAQELKIAPSVQPVKVAASPAQPAPVSPTPVAVAAVAPAVVPTAIPVNAAKAEATRPPKEAAVPLPATRSKPEAISEMPFTVAPQSSTLTTQAVREVTVPKQPAEAVGMDREATRAAIALETKQQLASLKSSILEELERNMQQKVSSGIEPIVRQAIEKQIAANFQSSIQTLNSDLTYQLAGHLAGSAELRNSIEKITKNIVEEQIEQSRKSLDGDLLNSNSRVAATTQSLEKTIAEMEDRLKVARDAAAATLDRVQATEREIADSTGRLQKIVDQLNLAARTTIEKFDTHVTAQLNSWSAQFKSHVDGVSQEKAAQFASSLEHQVSTQMQEANEVLEKLSAGLHLARGTARAQETQLTERSQAITAEFEKEIKAILIRLAGVN